MVDISIKRWFNCNTLSRLQFNQQNSLLLSFDSLRASKEKDFITFSLFTDKVFFYTTCVSISPCTRANAKSTERIKVSVTDKKY
jgi:hypothetical protein